MTDARYPERWLNDRRFLHLPDDVFRTFVVALTMCVSNRAEGHVSPDDLHHLRRPLEHGSTLVIAGLWDVEPDGTGWQIVDYVGTQTTRAELEAADAARKRERERKAEQRRRKAEEERAGRPAVPRDNGSVPGDVPRDSTGVPEDYTGKARASASARPSALDGTSYQVEDPDCIWPDAAVPGRGAA